ncbi:peptidoglycan -binding protein [Microvirga terrestris]|uniref:Peptidoglycan -binding protein n=1 Tax=Microvirga terrestris TaxID=2791024 RepID=A0ABS0HX17_9HYPH|nr:peptidoglycan -binding protein [Microvirga terrestris]MBF9198072.1 peptidoglycan -binding protein [Microvirga terrestris]
MPVSSAGGRRRGRNSQINYWPGFVDALSTLLLAIIFLISVFTVGQFFLSRELSGRDTVLDRLNRQISELTDLLSLERSSRRTIEETVTSLQTTLRANEAERTRLQGLLDSGGAVQAEAQQLNTQLESERQATGRALSQVEILNQQIAAMRRQLAALEDALSASENRDKESQARIADLGSRLNVALAQRVQELARYRSDFFGRLRQILGNRQDVRIVGDRFVFQSEVLFPGGQAFLRPEASGELDRIASALVELERQVPPDIPWVIRVDGHTDQRPINTAQFPSNWALSSARAIAVVQALIARGVQPQHLAAAGFGEFQPLDNGTTEEAYARNRRIELKLTER